jgi:hypothetical protein
MNMNDIRVAQTRDRFRFFEKTDPRLTVAENAGEDHLESDDPVQFGLPGSKNDAHPASAELGEDFVARDANQSFKKRLR